MVPLVVSDTRLPVRLALTSIAHGNQILWFSFLVSSYMSSIRWLMGGLGSGSLVPGGAAHRNSEDGSADVREVDILLSEIAVIPRRWSLYCRFLARKCLVGANPFFCILDV